jgi:hypothetical protein
MPKKKGGKKKEAAAAPAAKKVEEDEEPEVEEEEETQKSKAAMEGAKGLDSVTDVVEDTQLDEDKMKDALSTLGAVDTAEAAAQAAR